MSNPEHFEYKLEIPSFDGEPVEKVVLSFRPLALLPVGVLRSNRGDPEGQMWDTLEWGLSDQLELFDRVPKGEIRNIMEAWQESEDISLGESTASPASSTGTGRRSKRTSSETDSD